MLKKIIGIISVVALVMVSCMPIFAANYKQSGKVKTPTSISYKDLLRLQNAATATRGGTALIVNAAKYQNSDTVWMVRMQYSKDNETYLEDYVVGVHPYAYDEISKQVVSLPFTSIEDGTAKYGPSWFYFGVLDDVSHNLCGFAVAERVRRWPAWNDVSYSGTTYRGVPYVGSYPEGCSEAFMENHIH